MKLLLIVFQTFLNSYYNYFDFGLPGFLDNVCTDIIHYEEKKLVHYAGNLSEFVKVRCPLCDASVPSPDDPAAV